MTQPAPDEVLAELFAMKDIGHFQAGLNAETEEGKFKILAQLLTKEFRKFKLPPL
jgi:hypothetical protein